MERLFLKTDITNQAEEIKMFGISVNKKLARVWVMYESSVDLAHGVFIFHVGALTSDICQLYPRGFPKHLEG